MLNLITIACSLSMTLGAIRHSQTDTLDPPVFNQDQLEDWWGLAPAAEARRRALVESQIDSEWQHQKPSAVVDFDDPKSVLQHVLLHTGGVATVYPTEQYFYFAFDLGVRKVRGNLRFIDAHRGVIHIGYVDDVLSPDEVRHGALGIEDGVLVTHDATTSLVTVSHASLRVVFEIDQRVLNARKQTVLADGERLVSPILDESGHSFDLIYYAPERMFYYLRTDAVPSPEELIPFKTEAGHTLIVGRRTRFVFFRDHTLGRDVLVGVNSAEIRSNSYADGAFDQVPPRLEIRELLEDAYPYVKLNGGIDDHGNFLALEHQRVAISPYQEYGSLKDFSRDVDLLFRLHRHGLESWIMMTYESKRDFHKTIEAAARSQDLADAGAYSHDLQRSSRWPANHWSDLSIQGENPPMAEPAGNSASSMEGLVDGSIP